MKRRAGFTIIELLASMTIIAILAGIVVPKLGSFITQARATAAVGAVRAVFDAVEAYHATTDSFPPSGAMGQRPPALASDLEASVFVTADYQLQYMNWPFYQYTNGQLTESNIIAVTLQTSDMQLGQLAMAKSGWMHFQWGN
ncbi:MAG: type II secretion system protein, partial [Gemmatimonadota bacterium]|nr:type II secretion system protein [Gemmatimonadota bacterium]